MLGRNAEMAQSEVKQTLRATDLQPYVGDDGAAIDETINDAQQDDVLYSDKQRAESQESEQQNDSESYESSSET